MLNSNLGDKMKIFELIKSLTTLCESASNKIYYACNDTFTHFSKEPTIFYINEKDARHSHDVCDSERTFREPKCKTAICTFTGGKAASAEIANMMLKKLNPNYDEVPSDWFDDNFWEEEVNQRKQFIDYMTERGFDAVYMSYYDPSNYDRETLVLAVFDPSKHVNFGHLTDWQDFAPSHNYKIDQIVMISDKTVFYGSYVWEHAIVEHVKGNIIYVSRIRDGRRIGSPIPIDVEDPNDKHMVRPWTPRDDIIEIIYPPDDPDPDD